MKLFELLCCNNFVCLICLEGNDDLMFIKCPNCRKETDIILLKIASNIMLESFSKCPICGLEEKRKILISHLEDAHTFKIEEIDKIVKIIKNYI